MMAPGFKPVGWVAAVAGAAIGCYMLSLNVASERSELLKIERQIIAAKQQIRTLQTELGTRGRLAQLEQWNADILVLSAPTTAQFLENEVKLARFDQRAPTLDEKAELRMASADAAPEPRKIEAPVVQASAPAVPVAAPRSPLVHQASLAVPTLKPQSASAPALQPDKSPKPISLAAAAPKPIKTASRDVVAPKPRKPAAAQRESRIDATLVQEIGAAARLEANRGGR